MRDMSIVSKEWITVAEAAKRMKCSARTVLRAVEDERIRSVRVNPRLYLVHIDDVKAEAKREQTMGRPRGS